MSKFDDHDIDRYEWENLIDRWIFNERDRLLLKDRLLNGITYERLAEKYELSEHRTKMIVYKATEKLIKHI